MASGKTTITLAHHYTDPESGERHKPGDQLRVTEAEARRLGNAGMVAGFDPDQPPAAPAKPKRVRKRAAAKPKPATSAGAPAGTGQPGGVAGGAGA